MVPAHFQKYVDKNLGTISLFSREQKRVCLQVGRIVSQKQKKVVTERRILKCVDKIDCYNILIYG